MTDYLSEHFPAIMALAVSVRHVLTITELLKILLTVTGAVGGSVYAVGLAQGNQSAKVDQMVRDVQWIKDALSAVVKAQEETNKRQAAAVAQREEQVRGLRENDIRQEAAIRALERRK